MTRQSYSATPQLLAGKVALVTGASRGIGRAIAQRFAQDGALVAVHYGRDADAAAKTVAVIEAKGGSAFAVQADLVSLSQLEALFETLSTELAARTDQKTFDILVNNAGLGTFARYDQTTESEFDRLVAVNLKGTFFLTRLALPYITDGGRIIMLSTAATQHPSARATVSTMTKAALNALTVALAGDLGKRGITVNTLAPGATETDMNAEALTHPQARQGVERATALGRVGQVADIAGVAAFLASEDSTWVTGQYLEASGGLGLQR